MLNCLFSFSSLETFDHKNIYNVHHNFFTDDINRSKLFGLSCKTDKLTFQVFCGDEAEGDHEGNFLLERKTLTII